MGGKNECRVKTGMVGWGGPNEDSVIRETQKMSSEKHKVKQL